MAAAGATVPTRLVICVDGAQSVGAVETNIRQIYSSLEVGRCADRTHGGIFRQDIQYVPADGLVDDISSKERIQANLLGQVHLKQIQDIYEKCCKLDGEQDEVWFFGFSRGAFVVRAVAGLLHNFGSLASAGQPGFAKDFRKVLKDSETNSGNSLSSMTPVSLTPVSSIASSLQTKRAPRIQFVGVFDTISDVSGSNVFDISFNSSIHHFRHAVAMHEDRKTLAPECLYPFELNHSTLSDSGRSFIQAHFIGNHADMGGAAKKSGLALYPLQWMLIQAKDLGLVVDPQGGVFSPLSLILPGSSNSNPPEQLWTFKAANGITTQMQDFREVHGLSRNHDKSYAIRLQSSRLSSLRQKQPRNPFTSDGFLRGYCASAPQGTIIHPSVYLLLDLHINVVLENKELKLQRWVEAWRDQMLGNEAGQGADFWDDNDGDSESLGALRVLVCGNTGVGKSTLVNKTFGVAVTQSSNRTRGIHDVREEITWEGRPDLIVHDSGGFEAGADEEFQAIEAFLKEKAEAQSITAKLHVIWFCVDINSARTLQTATEKLFRAVSLYAKDVPIVVVATKKDELLDIEFGVCRKTLKREGKPFDEEICEQFAEEKLAERIEVIRSEMESVPGGRLDACIAVSQDDDESIASLSETTSQCFDTDRVRLMYIGAQVARIDLKIEMAVAEILRRYKRLIRRSAATVGFGGSSIHRKASTYQVTKAVIQCFGVPTVNADVALEALKANVWTSLGSNAQLVLAEMFSLIGVAGSVFAMGAPLWLISGSINASHVVPTTCRLFLIMACDLTLVLARSFKEATFRANGQPDEIDVGAAARNYAVRGYAQHVHRDVQRLIPKKNPLAPFRLENVQQGIEELFDAYKDKLMQDVNLPLRNGNTKAEKEAGDDASTDDDSALLHDYSEARATLAELDASETIPAVPELPGDDARFELHGESTVSELSGVSATKKSEKSAESIALHLERIHTS